MSVAVVDDGYGGTKAVVEEPCVVIDYAADTIDKYGWIQGSMGSKDTGFCALGALYHSVRQLAGETTEIEDSLDNTVIGPYIQPLIGKDTLTGWNDHKVKNKKQVVKTLRKAARNCRGKKTSWWRGLLGR